MRHLSPLLSPLLLSAGAALAAYGGYGAGLGRALAAGPGHWLQVAAAGAAALGLFAAGLRRSRPSGPAPDGDPPGSLADDLAALERLVPALRTHPNGLAALQTLIDILFQARHRPAPAPAAASSAQAAPETLAEQEGHTHA
jgi:hypothetical protein